MRLLRNVFRRKVRALLTIAGIAIGVLAIVLLGAIAERMTRLVDGGVTYYSGKVTVSSGQRLAETGMRTGLMSARLRQELEAVEGVACVSAEVSTALDDDPSEFGFGLVPAVVGNDGRWRGYEKYTAAVARGREVTSRDRGSVVLGADLATLLDTEVGDTVEIRGKPFRVIGVTEPLLSAPDRMATVSLHDARQLAYENLPASERLSVRSDSLVTNYVVYPKPGVDLRTLADRIERRVGGVFALGPEGIVDQAVVPLRWLTSVMYTTASISLVVGGMSVANTMAVAVSERTREIGVRKSIGASDVQIVRQFVAESAALGAIGGLAGLGAAAVIAAIGNAVGTETGWAIFLLTPRLALGALAFALGIGIASGGYPAYRAARLEPVQALRSS